MEDAEEIEALYEREMENADKEFLNGTQKAKDKKDAESAYKEKIKLIRESYEKRYEKYLKNQRRILKGNEKKTKKKKEKTDTFQVESINLKPTLAEKLRLRHEFFKFKFKIRRKNAFRKITPRFLLVLHIKTRIAMKRTVYSAREAIRRVAVKIRESTIAFLKNTAEKIAQVYSKVKKFLAEIFKKAASKIKLKKKGAEEAKTEDQKLAEKILGKSS